MAIKKLIRFLPNYRYHTTIMSNSVNKIFESASAFDDYCNDIKWFLQESGEIRIRYLIAEWDDEYTKGTREQKEILERLFAVMINYSSELAIQCNELREFMRDKIPEYYHDVGDWTNNTNNDETDIIIFHPLERQVNGMPIFDPDSIANHVLESVIQIRNYTRIMYTYLSLYINKLTAHIQYIKSQILKLELTRRSIHQITLHPLDCVIQFHMDEFMKLKKTYDDMNGQLCQINIDDNYVKESYFTSPSYIRSTFYKTYYNKEHTSHISVSAY